MHYHALEKSELKIAGIWLENTNLHRIVDCVANVFGLERDEVLVIDVRNGEVALDILSDDVDPHNFMGKERALLSQIALIPGVTLADNARITSEGMFGWIAFQAEAEEIHESIERAERMADQMMEIVSKRVRVYPSGTEVMGGEIEDTNTPMLIAALNEAGFTAEAAPVLPDEEDTIVYKLKEGAGRGYGVLITTGGVGAEDKDHSVESVLRLDPTAATPYIAKFTKGHGRHVKDGIRIAVGQFEHVRIITLPGPNDEVAACIPTLIAGLKAAESKEVLAEKLANVLRERLSAKMKHHKH